MSDKFKDLFNDSKSVKFGSVMFDLHESTDGTSSPQPGSGWASIEGSNAFRIKSVNELQNDVKWLTNLNQQTLWKSGAVKHNKLKHSSYLRTDVAQIMKEIGSVPPQTPIAEVCEQISIIFNRVMRLAIEFYGISEFNQKELNSEIKSKIIGEDRSISVHVDEALSRAYQDVVQCENFDSVEDMVYVSLKKPRLFHAKDIISSKIPLTLEDWDFISPDELVGDSKQKIEYLNSLQKPFIAKCSIANFGYSKDLNVDLSKILTLGEVFAEGGKTKERNWVCQPELNYLTKFSDIDVSAAFVSQGIQSLEDRIIIPSLGEMDDFSFSLGLLMENVWVALASRSVNPRTKVKSLISPRACWLKAQDKFSLLKSAMLISAYGYHIVSYGYGSINVFVAKDKVKDLISICPSAGLIAPSSIVNKYID